MTKTPIFVTRPFLPPLEEFLPYLEQIWDSRILTNNGPFHQELEQKLCEYLEVPYISLFSNGTLALVTALQALNIKGEVITTPFSFVATTHALWWNNIQPVFIDIEPETFTLDPKKIEEAITPKTTAILPVHVYGYPCKVERIQEIAQKTGLKVIYDAAHTFGSKYKGRHLAGFGDLSILSFHATKVFNTFEGGAIVCHTAEMKEHIDNLKNFGFRGETTVVEPGINAKMNEFQAALGLLQLQYLPNAIAGRASIFEAYHKGLQGIEGISLPAIPLSLEHNYAYYPVLIDGERFGKGRDEVYEALKREDIYSRRYFYPLISAFATYSDLPSATAQNLQISHQIADRVLCLPIYPGLEGEILEKIINVFQNK
ncbi:MAG TPA: DegT/DnrJ/EryC1/StrS family aminotransferase [Bacteroidales bacterium]|nr:DegT/DnrJ/EryC1/StrS family aminotransferase [Bacteroidales bacterium]